MWKRIESYCTIPVVSMSSYSHMSSLVSFARVSSGINEVLWLLVLASLLILPDSFERAIDEIARNRLHIYSSSNCNLSHVLVHCNPMCYCVKIPHE